MNTKILVFFLILTSNLCFAQKQHEIKADMLALLEKGSVGLSYEYGLTKKIGLEVDVRYDYRYKIDFQTNTIINSQFPDTSYHFEMQFIDFSFGANYYFAPKNSIDKFFSNNKKLT